MLGTDKFSDITPLCGVPEELTGHREMNVGSGDRNAVRGGGSLAGSWGLVTLLDGDEGVGACQGRAEEVAWSRQSGRQVRPGRQRLEEHRSQAGRDRGAELWGLRSLNGVCSRLSQSRQALSRPAKALLLCCEGSGQELELGQMKGTPAPLHGGALKQRPLPGLDGCVVDCKQPLW